jgi:hypothetical protein
VIFPTNTRSQSYKTNSHQTRNTGNQISLKQQLHPRESQLASTNRPITAKDKELTVLGGKNRRLEDETHQSNLEDTRNMTRWSLAEKENENNEIELALVAKESMLRKRDEKLGYLKMKWRHEQAVVEGFMGLDAAFRAVEKKLKRSQKEEACLRRK